MNYNLIVYDSVADEVEDAAFYYDMKQSGLGQRLLNDWEKSLETIAKNPLGYQKKYSVFRQIQLQKFPYLIMFEIEANNIIVFKFINAKQHPVKRYKAK